MTPDQIVSEANERGVQLVRFLYCDNGGVIRGKSTHVGQLARRMQSGIGLVKGMQSFTSLDFLAPDATYGPVGEIRLIPDPDTFVILPYAPRSGQMVVNMVELDHQPWALDPRAFLQRMVATAAARDLAFDAAFENEFFLAYRTDDGFVPVDRSLCFSAIGMESTEPVIQDIIAALTDQGLTVELSHPELGWGQQELSIRHAPALRAADNQITYRQTVRAVAAQHDMVATLAPKPWADQAGSGAHLHWSIWDAAHTTNRLADPEGLAGLSTLAHQAIAGVLTHLPALLGMTTPSVNSFRRLQPHFWSSAYTAWGIENREAAVRVPTRYWDDEAGSTNLELKASDSSANPYIALGGVMAAALDGIERGLDPGEPVNEDPGNLSDAERERRGIRRFPLTASEALDELERDEVLTSAMGEGLATEYLKVRRAEAAAYAEHDEAYELDQHFFKY
ncbi:MAG TPA: glutamine synthetase family protein [Candidatus Limnocylindrales bacterium]|nr:glutamine synthetase family protein [Candidatus Limnocylindrales bacterium]